MSFWNIIEWCQLNDIKDGQRNANDLLAQNNALLEQIRRLQMTPAERAAEDAERKRIAEAKKARDARDAKTTLIACLCVLSLIFIIIICASATSQSGPAGPVVHTEWTPPPAPMPQPTPIPGSAWTAEDDQRLTSYNQPTPAPTATPEVTFQQIYDQLSERDKALYASGKNKVQMFNEQPTAEEQAVVDRVDGHPVTAPRAQLVNAPTRIKRPGHQRGP